MANRPIGMAPTDNILQELALLNHQYQSAIKADRPFEEVKEIFKKIKELEKELEKRNVRAS